MDAERFDALTRNFFTGASRRGLFVALVSGLAMFAAGPEVARGGARCKDGGAKCKKSSECCAGSCKGKKRKKRKCQAAPDEARGCAVNDPYGRSCPGRTNDSQYCWVTLDGKPFCGTSVKCFSCASNADCAQEVGFTGARCVETPEGCSAQYNYRSCVIFP